MLAGLTARMWQAKCYEERGDIGPAIGIYNELLEHQDPRLRPLQRHVAYFRIIARGKRKEYALAADEAAAWLRANGNSPDRLRDLNTLGVRFELAKNIVAQLPEIANEKDKADAVKRVTDELSQVVRYSSPFKAEALALLKKYKPNAGAAPADVSKLNYDEAIARGEEAVAAEEWARAAALFRQAVRRAESARDVEKANTARYNLTFVYFRDKRYYEAAVLADHLARRYPQWGLSARAAEIGMEALAQAYNALKIDRTADLDNLVELAKYTADAYPDTDQGDSARMYLGQIDLGTGKYAEAAAAYEAVRPKSGRWPEARTRAGDAHWKQGVALRAVGKTSEADAETAKALAVLDEALKSRRDTGTPPTDPGLIENACDIAVIDLETGKPDEALKLLDPIAAQQGANPTGPAFTRLTSTRLRAHVAVDKSDLAMADMAALEKAGGGGGLTQLYFQLGTLLKKEMDNLEKRGDRARLHQRKQSYLQFLTKLADSKSGQTFESLSWVGNNMLALDRPKEAQAVFVKVLKDYGDDKKPPARPVAADQLMLVRLKLAAALRGQRNFGEAESLVDKVLKENPNKIEPMMEKGLLVEEKAAAGKATWPAAFAQWRAVAQRLGNARTRPVAYYEAWYHAALVLKNENKTQEAKQTLALVMRLSPAVGGPEMKAKYQALFNQLK
jgi:tetratricopeptide (TPR) repeat protein